MTVWDEGSAAEQPATEAMRYHNRIQKLALGVEESRAYWRHVLPGEALASQSERAFDERWFGAKTLARIRVLMTDLRARYAAFPKALEVLRSWPGMEPETRRLVCHWHLQLADPLYRRLSGGWLIDRRLLPRATIGFRPVLQWVLDTNPKDWSPSTCRQVAGKLLSAVSEAGLVTPPPDPRRISVPRVPDKALGYILHLLRELQFEGTPFENPYLGSVGLSGVLLEQRLSVGQWGKVHRMGGLTQIEWKYPSLRAWAETEL